MIGFDQVRTSFYNRYRHGPTAATEPEPLDYHKEIKDALGRPGLEYIKSEFSRIINKPFRKQNLVGYKQGKLYKFEDFNTDEFLKHWTPITDSDTNHGFSTAILTRSPNNHALLKGVIDTRRPQDGVTCVSGFAGMLGPKRPSDSIFRTENYWNWSSFNAIEIRLRADGRKYTLMVNTSDSLHDQHFFDARCYPLFTSGGPYWQTFRIPLSKFILTYKDNVQDFQTSFPTKMVSFVGITLNDMISGPYCIEVDYIGLIDDPQPFREDCAYERYVFPHIKYRQLQVESQPPDWISGTKLN